MEIGSKVKQLRNKASLTQEQLAQELGISSQSVSKWETGASMPDITLLPRIAEIFGISIDELFDLTVDQKLRRIENRMDVEEELDGDVFREYEDFLKAQIKENPDRRRVVSLLAHLYNHRLTSYAAKISKYAREAITLDPGKRDAQWLLQQSENSKIWDWNVDNHAKTIEFYKEVIENDKKEPKSALPFFYIIDNLIDDHRTEEAKEYLERFRELPSHRAFMVPIYEAAIALAEFDEKKADEIIENAKEKFSEDSGFLFEVAQYYARKCRYDRAIEYYEASFKAEENEKPRFWDALQGIATIYEIRGEYKKAVETQKSILDVLKNEWGFTEEVTIREVEGEIERLSKKCQ
jgi:transcriptional regulator with XRE-family HTH domain